MENKYSLKGVLISLGKCALFYALYLLIQIVSVALITLAFGLIAPEKLDYITQMSVELNIIAGCITILVFALLARAFKTTLSDMAHFNKMPPRFIISMIVMGVATSYVIILLLSGAELLNLIPDSWVQVQNDTYEDVISASPLLQVLCVGIIAPLLEEILFRGCILGTLKKEMHPWIAICISAILFGVAHGTPLGIIYATVLGLMMGWLMVRFNSIVPSILFHIAYNLTVSFGGGLTIFTMILPIPILILEIVDIIRYFRGKQI